MTLISLCPLSTFKTQIGVTTGTSNDTYYLSFLLSATSIIEQYCQCVFQTGTYTEYFKSKYNYQNAIDLYGSSYSGGLRGYKPYKIKVAAKPITGSSIDVRYDTSMIWNEDSVLHSTENDLDYIWDATKGTIDILCLLTEHTKSIKVVYTGGYAIGTDGSTSYVNVPSDLQMACLVQASFLYEKIKQKNMGMAQDRAVQGDVAVSFSRQDSICADIFPFLSGYIRRDSNRTI